MTRSTINLTLQSVSVTYTSGPAVIDVSHEIAAGEWVSLIGPNGAGKTSLLRACLGLVEHGGTITIGGTDLACVSVAERSRLIAYAPQDPLLPTGMTAMEYTLLGRTPYISPTAPSRPTSSNVSIWADTGTPLSQR
jgi:iron complex transport system ATP-binding protein